MEEGCSTQKQVLNYLGERFRVKLSLPEWYPNEEAAKFLFKYVCFAEEWGRSDDGICSCLESELGQDAGPSKEGGFASIILH